MKLNKFQRKELKEFKLFNHEAEFYTAHGVTLCIMRKFPGSKMTRVGIAICAPEDKFRRKTGEYLAYLAFYSIVVPHDFDRELLCESICHQLEDTWALESEIF